MPLGLDDPVAFAESTLGPWLEPVPQIDLPLSIPDVPVLGFLGQVVPSVAEVGYLVPFPENLLVQEVEIPKCEQVVVSKCVRGKGRLFKQDGRFSGKRDRYIRTKDGKIIFDKPVATEDDWWLYDKWDTSTTYMRWTKASGHDFPQFAETDDGIARFATYGQGEVCCEVDSFKTSAGPPYYIAVMTLEDDYYPPNNAGFHASFQDIWSLKNLLAASYVDTNPWYGSKSQFVPTNTRKLVFCDFVLICGPFFKLEAAQLACVCRDNCQMWYKIYCLDECLNIKRTICAACSEAPKARPGICSFGPFPTQADCLTFRPTQCQLINCYGESVSTGTEEESEEEETPPAPSFPAFTGTLTQPQRDAIAAVCSIPSPI